MKRLLLAAAMLLPVYAGAAEYSRLQAEKSSITFVSKQMGVAVDGAFRKFSASVKINPAKPEAGSARMEVDLSGIDAGGAEANDEVQGKSWFDTAAFPKAVFELGAVRALGGGKYEGPGKFEAMGKLTIKGKSVPLTVPFTLQESKGELVVDGSFKLKRLEFGIGSGIWGDTSVVADEVLVKFHLLLK